MSSSPTNPHQKKKQRRKQRKEEEEEAAGEDKTAARKEEELRAELRTLRELSQSNEALLQVNRKLKRKVRRRSLTISLTKFGQSLRHTRLETGWSTVVWTLTEAPLSGHWLWGTLVWTVVESLWSECWLKHSGLDTGWDTRITALFVSCPVCHGT